MYGKFSLENKITQKGVESEKGLCHEYDGTCVMNMRDLRHEYEGGCILKETFYWQGYWG